MATQPERVVLTYQDLLQLPNDRNRYELFDGELQATAAPNIAHQTASINLALILGNHIRANRLGRLFTAPCDVLLCQTTVVEPDLLFVSAERAEIIQSQYVAGAPDLVVEILSPSTALADGVYQAVARGKETETVSAPPFPDLAIALSEIWD